MKNYRRSGQIVNSANFQMRIKKSANVALAYLKTGTIVQVSDYCSGSGYLALMAVLDLFRID